MFAPQIMQFENKYTAEEGQFLGFTILLFAHQISTLCKIKEETYHMSTISIALPDASYNKLKEKAAELGFPLEELVKISVEDFLRHPDEQFSRIVDEILEENAELYRRLA